MNGENVCAVVLDYYGAEKTEKCLMSLCGQGLKAVYVLDTSGEWAQFALLAEASRTRELLGYIAMAPPAKISSKKGL